MLMAPVVSWRTQDNKSEWPEGGVWKVGVVKAGFEAGESSRARVLIWNNYNNQEEDAPNMENVDFTVLSNEDGFVGQPVGPIVTRKVITIRNLSIGETEPTPVGGETAHHIYTEGSTFFDGLEHRGSQTYYEPDPANPPPVGPGQPVHYPSYSADEQHTCDILGVRNDGTKENSQANFVEVELSAFPDPMTPSGKFKFLMRVSYWH